MRNEKLARLAEHSRKMVYASLPAPVKTMFALARLAGMGKQAFSKSDINKLIEGELRRGGAYTRLGEMGLSVPRLDFGTMMHIGVAVAARKYGLSAQDKADYLNDVVGDMVLGQSVNALVDRGPWKMTLPKQIEEWLVEGREDSYIKNNIIKWTSNKVHNLLRRSQSMQGEEMTGFSPGQREEGDTGKKEVFEEALSLGGIAESQLSNYYSILRTNTEARDLVKQIGRLLENRHDSYGLLWQAYVKDPAASMRELVFEDVKTKGGDVVPLWQALGYDDPQSTSVPGKIHNQLKGLRTLIKGHWPEVEEVLREM